MPATLDLDLLPVVRRDQLILMKKAAGREKDLVVQILRLLEMQFGHLMQPVKHPGEA